MNLHASTSVKLYLSRYKLAMLIIIVLACKLLGTGKALREHMSEKIHKIQRKKK